MNESKISDLGDGQVSEETISTPLRKRHNPAWESMFKIISQDLCRMERHSAEAGSMSITLEATISAEGEYFIGRPLTINSTLTNTGATDVWVLAWNTFLEGNGQSYVRIGLHGTPLRYDGILASRANPRAESYRRIPAGGSLTETVDLDRGFAMTQAGEYTLSLVLNIHDAFEAPTQPPRRKAQHTPLRVTSNTIRLTVHSEGNLLPTDGARMMKAKPALAPTAGLGIVGNGALKPTTTGASPGQIDQIMAAWNWAYEGIQQAQSPGSYPEQYGTWFGSYSGSAVTDTLGKILNWMENHQVDFDLEDPFNYCKWDYLAWTSYENPTIYLCPLFFRFITSVETQAETVVHELAHSAADAADSMYGQINCSHLAQFNPDSAADNAASFAYFVTDIYPAPYPATNGIWTNDSGFGDTTQRKPTATLALGEVTTLMFAYQNSDTSDASLYYRATNNSTSNWNGAHTIHNPITGSNCKTLLSPALASIGDVIYCVYIDGDPKSPYYNWMVYIITSDGGSTWTQPAPAISPPPITAKDPAMAFFNGNLYCAYVNSQGGLAIVQGNPSADAKSVYWNPTAPIGQPAYQPNSEPALGVFNNQLYCMYTGSDSSLRLTTSTDGATWTPEQSFPDCIASAAPALGVWRNTNQLGPLGLLLVCLYTGPTSDPHLRYMVYDGTSWSEAEFRESSNAATYGPAIASGGTTLFAFYRGESNGHVYWCQTNVPSQGE